MTEEEKIKTDADIFNSQQGSLDGYDCNICKNKGVVYKPIQVDVFGRKSWELVSSECSCISVRAEIKRIKQSGLENLLGRCTFDYFLDDKDWQKTIKGAAHKYANTLDGWFMIGGQPGCGKTHICTAIVGQLLREGKSAKYMIWQDEITALKQNINNTEAYEYLINIDKNADVLYIDDFFKTRKGEFVSTADVNQTFRIINHRYNNQLPTIISSELSILQITMIDEALGSRIAEMCKDEFKLFVSPDSSKNYRF